MFASLRKTPTRVLFVTVNYHMTGANVPRAILDGSAEGAPARPVPAPHHRVFTAGVHQAVPARLAGELHGHGYGRGRAQPKCICWQVAFSVVWGHRQGLGGLLLVECVAAAAGLMYVMAGVPHLNHSRVVLEQSRSATSKLSSTDNRWLVPEPNS